MSNSALDPIELAQLELRQRQIPGQVDEGAYMRHALTEGAEFLRSIASDSHTDVSSAEEREQLEAAARARRAAAGEQMAKRIFGSMQKYVERNINALVAKLPELVNHDLTLLVGRALQN